MRPDDRPVDTATAHGLEVEGVNLSYGTNHVLKNVSLQVRPGEFFAFLGPSGCGKTTLLRLVAGFNQADSGRVLLDGRDLSDLPPWRRDIGMVFQSYALWPHMTVAQNVAFGPEERRLPRAEVRRRVDAALALVGLGAFAGRRPSQLSGGQQQRVALARTLAVEPKLLLLDEPLSNLDAQMRLQVRRELRELQLRLGLTTIFVTHDQEEANAICDRMAVMRDGVVQQIGSPQELYRRPANLFVAGFLGTTNVLAGEMAGDRSTFCLRGGGIIPVPTGISIDASTRPMFRPQDAELDASTGEGDINLKGLITHREFRGTSIQYSVLGPAGELLVEQPFRSAGSLLDLNSEVQIRVSVSDLLWLSN